jgi:hypothetical protein
MKIVFKDVSMGGQFIDCLYSYFGRRDNIEYFFGDIQWLDVQGKALMSPESSFCTFGYGLEHCYQDMFQGIEEKVQEHMTTLNKVTPDGRHYLPIGSAIMVPTQNVSTYILASPTVFMSKDIKNTRNAYHSFMAALCVFDKFKKATNNHTIDTIVCPCHLFGGILFKLSYAEAAKQIWEAYHDFMSVKRPMEVGDKSDPYSYVTTSKCQS